MITARITIVRLPSTGLPYELTSTCAPPRTSAASARFRSETPATRSSMKACPGIFGRPDDLAAHESAAIPPEIAPRPDEPVIVKGKPSAFFGTQLHSMLTYHNVDTLIITGMVTSGCVRATALSAA